MGRKLTGSVRLKRGKWNARVGTEYLGSYDTEQEAWDIVNAWLATEGLKGKVPDTLRLLGVKWLERRERDGLVRGIRQERSVWRAHVETAPFADWPLKRIQPKHVYEWVRGLLKKQAVDTVKKADGVVKRKTGRTLSRQVVLHALKVLRLFLDDAAMSGKITSNPARAVKVPKVARIVEDSDAWTFLTLDEIDRLFALKMPAKWRAVYAVAIYCGLRRGEIWGLRWEDVELDGDDPHLRVRRSYKGPVKEAASRREVPLFPPAVAALSAWKRDGGIVRAKGPVFPSESGSVYGRSFHAGWYDHRQRVDGKMTIRKGWRSKANIRPHVRFHDLRHTFCSHLVMGSWGWPERVPWRLEDIRPVAGHSTRAVTERYAHLSPESARSLARSMGPRSKKENKGNGDPGASHNPR